MLLFLINCLKLFPIDNLCVFIYMSRDNYAICIYYISRRVLLEERCKRAWGRHPPTPQPLIPYPHPPPPTPNTLNLTPCYPHLHPHHPTPLLSHTLQPYLLSCYQCLTLPHLIRVKNSTISDYLTLSMSKFTIQLQCTSNT